MPSWRYRKYEDNNSNTKRPSNEAYQETYKEIFDRLTQMNPDMPQGEVAHEAHQAASEARHWKLTELSMSPSYGARRKKTHRKRKHLKRKTHRKH